MGKRSSFERVERDFYPTPYEAVAPLIPFLGEAVEFDEPCAGDGRLIDHLEKHGHSCVGASDLEPMRDDVAPLDVFDVTVCFGKVFITNPPWNRKILHPIIEHLLPIAPAFLLFDADWMHTKQASKYLTWCTDIISVGTVEWIEGSKMTGKDNCCWYRFAQDAEDLELPAPRFWKRT